MGKSKPHNREQAFFAILQRLSLADIQEIRSIALLRQHLSRLLPAPPRRQLLQDGRRPRVWHYVDDYPPPIIIGGE